MRYPKYHIAVIALMLTPAISFASSSGSDPDVTGTIWDHVQSMIDTIGDTLPPDARSVPVDGTSVLRMFMEGSLRADNPPSRVADPPTSWTLVHTGERCKVYIAQDVSVPPSEYEGLADLFDGKIYPNATYWFDPVSPPASVNFRIYDMGDGEGGVGGFFIRSPLYKNDLFVDSEDISISDEVVAHEFEHLLHYGSDPNEEIWLDEGMADLSIRVSLGYTGDALQNHIDMLSAFPENGLLVWDEGVPPYEYEDIADYGAAYTYVAYLADRFGGVDLMRGLMSDTRNSLDSVENQLELLGHDESAYDVFKMVKVANLADDPEFGAGIYDQGLMDIGIQSMRDVIATYPHRTEIDDSKAYSGYYIRSSPSSPVEVMLSSESNAHASIVGMSSGAVIWARNITSTASSTAKVVLDSGPMGSESVYIIPSTTSSGSWMRLDVRTIETPVTSLQVQPPLPDGLSGWYVTPPRISLGTEGGTIFYRWGINGPFNVYDTTLVAPEGQSTLQFYSVLSGVTEEVRSLDLLVDSVPPATILTLSPVEPDGANGFYHTRPVMVLGTEPGSTAFFEIGAGPVEYDSPVTLGDGTTIVRYWSIDQAGNSGDMMTREVKVDLSEPGAEMVTTPESPDGENGHFISSVKVEFRPDTGSSVNYWLDGSAEMSYDGPIMLGDGEHTIVFQAASPSGKVGPLETRTILVDTVIPGLIVDTDPSSIEGWTNRSILLIMSSDDPLAELTYGIQGITFQYRGPALLSDGRYDVVPMAVDPAGNTRIGASISVAIDTTKPRTDLVFERDPDYENWFHDSLPKVSARSGGTTLSPESTFYSVNDGPFVPLDGDINGLGSGLNTVRFYSVDEAGNREDVRTRQIGLDLADPKASVRANRTIVGGPGPVRFDMSRSSDDHKVLYYRLELGDGTDTGWIRDAVYVHRYDSLGDYRVKVTVKDAAGRVGQDPATVRVEVLTPEEAARRLAELEGPSPFLVGLALVVLSVIIISSASLGVLWYLRRRAERLSEGDGQDTVMEWD